jgi:hypothetical protein
MDRGIPVINFDFFESCPAYNAGQDSGKKV